MQVNFFNLIKTLSAARLFTAAVAVCIGFAAIWFGGLNQDEGWYLYAAQLVSEGKLPYRDFFFTQGPALPFVYSVLSPIWTSGESFLHGLLGGRIITFVLGILATFMAVAITRRLVPEKVRSAAGLAVFALLSCNIYHVYFTTIPKTYALGSLFLLAGFLMLTIALERHEVRRGLSLKVLLLLFSGISVAFASGTRISLILILPVIGFSLLYRFRDFGWSFLFFGIGGVIGLFLVYGFFALDPVSLNSLIAAQNYHAARGGFDPMFSIGSISRLVRAYGALSVVFWAALFVTFSVGSRSYVDGKRTIVSHSILWMLVLSFAAVFCLQISAPFPYDDYQVPLMGLLTIPIVVWFFRSTKYPLERVWFVIIVSVLVSFASPLLQEWTTYKQDRFWSRKMECTELAKLRAVAREINRLDPDGDMLLTQDLYLAIEAGRKVPKGFEMGPFSYFPGLSTKEAQDAHVMNKERLIKLLESAPCNIIASSGYAFAIEAPLCNEVHEAERKEFEDVILKNYDLIGDVENYGQNETTLRLYKRKE